MFCVELVFAGGVVATIVENNEATSATIFGYNPATNSFTSDFGGGLYSSGLYPLQALQSTPMLVLIIYFFIPQLICEFVRGMFAAGSFTFVGNNLTYSAGVTQIIDEKFSGLPILLSTSLFPFSI